MLRNKKKSNARSAWHLHNAHLWDFTNGNNATRSKNKSTNQLRVIRKTHITLFNSIALHCRCSYLRSCLSISISLSNSMTRFVFFPFTKLDSLVFFPHFISVCRFSSHPQRFLVCSIYAWCVISLTLYSYCFIVCLWYEWLLALLRIPNVIRYLAWPLHLEFLSGFKNAPV